MRGTADHRAFLDGAREMRLDIARYFFGHVDQDRFAGSASASAFSLLCDSEAEIEIDPIAEHGTQVTSRET